jgi:hypothetical protein
METWELEQIPRSIATVPEGSWAARAFERLADERRRLFRGQCASGVQRRRLHREITRMESKAPLFVARVIRGLHLRQRKRAEIGGETIKSVKLGRNDARGGGVGVKRG